MTTTPTSGAADLRTAAQAVVDRWDTPLWKDVPATAEYIGRLRAALAAGQATASQQGAYAALSESFLEIPDVQDESGINAYYSREVVLECIDAALAAHGQAPAETGNSVSAQADSVLYDPKAVLDVFNSARAGSDKSSGYLRGILAVIAHWESRPEPHRWMVPVQAQAAESVPAGDERATFEANWRARNPHMPLNSRLRDDGRYGDHLIQKEWEAWQARAARASADSVQEDAARLDWLLLRVSGAEFRRIGVHYSGNARRADVDAARKQGENHD